MTTLTDYLENETLQQLQDIFTQVTRAPLRIYDPQGVPVTQASQASASGAPLPPELAGQPTADGQPVEMPIVVQGNNLGRIVLERPSHTRWPAEQMSALAEALSIPLSDLRRALQRVPEVDSEANHLAVQMLAMMARVIVRLCSQEHQLRARLDDLATLYRLTALFTAKRDLKQVLETVAATVVAVTKVKSCSIRLLNAETQELSIQAVANLSQEYLNKGPILLSKSVLDSEAVQTHDVVYIEDETTDPRVMYPNEARREGIVSALISPLMYRGRPVGALHLYTDCKHKFGTFETALVKAISGQAAAAIVNAQLYTESLQAEAMRRQVRVAGEVQRRMIPASPPHWPGLDIAAVYVPSLELSGDFYDFIELPAGNLGLSICDVMGKGIPASLLMASIRANLRAHVSHIYDLSEVLRRVNRSLCDDTVVSEFATLFYGVINTRNMEFTYANAGHEPPMLVRNGQVRHLSTGGTVLGIERDLRYSHEVVDLEPRDVVVLFTDGLIDAMNFRDECFGRERVQQAVLTGVERAGDANSIAQHVLWEMRRFAGLRVRPDDLTMVVIRLG